MQSPEQWREFVLSICKKIFYLCITFFSILVIQHTWKQQRNNWLYVGDLQDLNKNNSLRVHTNNKSSIYINNKIRKPRGAGGSTFPAASTSSINYNTSNTSSSSHIIDPTGKSMRRINNTVYSTSHPLSARTVTVLCVGDSIMRQHDFLI